jgi:hypothetical protein
VIAAIITLSLLLLASTFYAFRFALILMRVESSLEESLDTLDSCYVSIGKILERPLFFDSVEVRHVIFEIAKAQSAVLKVAQAISANVDSEEPAAKENDLQSNSLP